MAEGYFRADFKLKVIKTDDESRTVHFTLEPDPRRYEKIEKDGEVLYRDKYLNFIFPEKTIQQMALQANGMPVEYAPVSINSAEIYSKSRKEALEQAITSGVYTKPTEEADKHRMLDETASELDLTFVSVDICNSTKLQRKYGAQYDQVYDLFFKELGAIVGSCHGFILKGTGDGFIAVMDEESINSQCDNTIDMCLTMLGVLHTALNAASINSGLPSLSIRIGAEHGAAQVTSISVPATGFSQRDVKSHAINLAVKIQEAALPNTLMIGRALYERIHVQWLEICTPANIDLTDEIGIDNYQIYRVA